jgi:hypothetical protein
MENEFSPPFSVFFSFVGAPVLCPMKLKDS